MKECLISHCNLCIFYDPVVKFIFNKNEIIGVVLNSGKELKAKKIVLTTGTFLNGVIHIGNEMKPGRHGEDPTKGLSEQLKKFNLNIARLKPVRHLDLMGDLLTSKLWKNKKLMIIHIFFL